MSKDHLKVGAIGEEVKNLQARLLERGLDIPKTESERGFFGPATREAVRKCQAEGGLPASGVVCPKTEATIGARTPTAAASAGPSGIAVSSSVPAPAAVAPIMAAVAVGSGGKVQQRLTGFVHLEYGLPAAGVTLRVYHRGFGGAEARVGEVRTGEDGSYAFAYSSGERPANLEVRALAACRT